jgi:hypothetical protein
MDALDKIVMLRRWWGKGGSQDKTATAVNGQTHKLSHHDTMSRILDPI